jgi:tRNA(Ile)-lysidine synthase
VHKQNSSVLLAELGSELKIALAVSGGSDSIAMLRMVLERHAQNLISVLTVDHGLRAGSDAEAQQVSAWCAELGVAHAILKWEGPKPVTAIQAKARAARYDLMTAWCAANDVSILLTGHTADDQNETVLMRRQRTKSSKSLAGIWPERDWKGIRILRPVLNFSRLALRGHLQSIGQNWLDDPSNDNEKFERVRIRKALIGTQLQYGEEAKLAQDLVKQDELAANMWMKAHLQIHALGFVTLERAGFENLTLGVQDFVLLHILRLCGGGTGVELKERLALLAWVADAAPSRRVLGGALFMKRRREMIVGREPGRISSMPQIIPASGELIWDGRFRVQGPEGAQVVAAGFGPKTPRNVELPAFIQAGLPVLVQEGAILPFQHKLELLPR